MRVPKVTHFSESEKVKTLKLERPIIIPRLPVITNDKQRDKLIKTIEKYIRSSMEYKDLIKFLKDKLDMTSCSFFQNVKGGKKKGVIEIHHEPYDLYLLTTIVMNKQEKTKGYINKLEIAEEVMFLHYSGLVGLFPVSVTVHELIHAGKILVPLDCVYGNFVKFTKDYLDYIEPQILDMLDIKIDMTKKLDRKDLSILDVKYVYIETDGFILPQVVNS